MKLPKPTHLFIPIVADKFVIATFTPFILESSPKSMNKTFGIFYFVYNQYAFPCSLPPKFT